MSATPSTVLTPSVRVAARRWAYWVAFGTLVLVIAIVSSLATGSDRTPGNQLDPEGAGPDGARALIEVLRDQGVDVTLAASAREAAAATEADATTVVVHDRDRVLDRVPAEVAERAEHLIIIDPAFDMLHALAPGVAQAGAVEGVAIADCGLGAVERADVVTVDGVGYRQVDEDARLELCLVDRGVASLVQLEVDGRTVTVLGTTAALSNEHIAEEGNAAFALGLLGEHPHLVWYVPGLDDLPDDSDSIAELTPRWVSPAIILLIVATIALGVAQGRRLGPLVIENLPVTVRATETMEGRARLYQRSSARLRALDALRIGTVQRLATRLKVQRTAGVEEVAMLTAGLLGRRTDEVRALLLDTIPRSDRELIDLSDRLLELERAVTDATTP